jgi:hypothetical protein
MAGSPTPLVIKCIVLFCPPDQGKYGLAEFFPVFRERIFHPGRDLGKRFPVDQVFFPEIFQDIGQGLGADPVKVLHDVIEPDLLVVTDGADHENYPFPANNGNDAFQGTEADVMVVTFFFHSDFKTFNLALLILSN